MLSNLSKFSDQYPTPPPESIYCQKASGIQLSDPPTPHLSLFSVSLCVHGDCCKGQEGRVSTLWYCPSPHPTKPAHVSKTLIHHRICRRNVERPEADLLVISVRFKPPAYPGLTGGVCQGVASCHL
jgi:hypothetical protein